MQQVVFATDGSKNATAALAEIARRNWPPGTSFSVIAVDGGHLAQAAAKEVLADSASKLSETFPDHVESQLLHGDVGDSIVQFCEKRRADLLVVGAHGVAKKQRLFVGSITDHVVHRASCNILIVKERLTEAEEHRHRPNRVLICVGNKSTGQELVRNVSERKWLDDTEFKLLHVFPAPTRAYSPDPTFDFKLFQDEERKERARFEYWLKKLGSVLREQTGGSVETFVLESDDASRDIVYATAEFDVDLVIVGPREHTGVNEVLLGSVSKAVLAHAPCSVEILKCKVPIAN